MKGEWAAMPKEPGCLFCKSFAYIDSKDEILMSVICDRCGNYVVNVELIDYLLSHPPDEQQIANIAGWLYEHKGARITDDNYKDLLNMKTPGFSEKADRLLLALKKRSKNVGYEIIMKREKNGNEILKEAYLANDDELFGFIRCFERLGWIGNMKSVYGAAKFELFPEGYKRIEELEAVNPESPQCFVAMSFDEKLNFLYEDYISKAIEDAGYKPFRVDDNPKNDYIDQEIMIQIRRSRFMVADFTQNKNGVYFEAGYARGLGIPVIWTCKEKEDPHFDTRQIRHIFWKDDELDKFQKELQTSIEYNVGDGPNKVLY